MATIGNFNPCLSARLYDKKGKLIGMTMGTPNCIAWAMAKYPQIFKAVTSCKGWADEVTFRDDVSDRISWHKNHHASFAKNTVIF